MILVPYTYKCFKNLNRQFHVIRVMTEGGMALWSESDEILDPREALETNDLFSKATFQQGDHHYFAIDEVRTPILSMYEWKELPLLSDALCWRTFYVITDSTGRPWIPIQSGPFKPALEAILNAS